MEVAKEQEVILGIQTYSDEGPIFLRQVGRQLKLFMKIDTVSSVYRVHSRQERGAHLHDLRTYHVFEGLVVSLKCWYGGTPLELKSRLESIREELEKSSTHCSVHFSILLFGQETLLLPNLTLPDPDLHLRPEQIIPSAEVAPHWRHPVLQMEIKELAKSFTQDPWGEFVCQGQPLLDFSRNDQ